MANRLVKETSPYLLQHAHNPVDWYPWSDEAFEKAKRENKIVIVSIGYSTCHWCHVMERESFEDQDTADFMNEYFVSIKVDREERPDLDQIYMEACQAINGNGGWPLNAFLLPDGRPFFAGTYFPPMPAHNRPSWLVLLRNIYQSYTHKKEEILGQADKLMAVLNRSEAMTFDADFASLKNESWPDKNVGDTVFQKMKMYFDSEDGGFGSAPKFPGSMSLDFLLSYAHQSKSEAANWHVKLSLDKMCRGGIYDLLGGAFARYATDRAWLIPHFEKMLYDNALLVGTLADAYKLTKSDLYLNTINETLDWVIREMLSPEGGFYSALDADSEGVEGKFYVWSKKEIDEVLGNDADLFCAFYDVSESGNWEHTNILWRPKDLEDFAKDKGKDKFELEEQFGKNRLQLFNARASRIRPGLDDKILLDWNALMAKAFAQAYKLTDKSQYKEVAIANVKFIMDHMVQDDGIGLFHTYKQSAKYDGFLNDYAFFIDALIEIYEITFDTKWLKIAADYADYTIDHFFDPENHLFFFTSNTQEKLVLRKRDLYDSATPSGNSTMASVLKRLGYLFENDNYLKIYRKMLFVMEQKIKDFPTSFSRWALLLHEESFPLREITVMGEDAYQRSKNLFKRYIPNMVIMASIEENDEFPLLKGKPLEKETEFYLCENFACQAPVQNEEELLKMLNK